MLLWLVAHSRLLTNGQHERCQLSNSNGCQICASIGETTLHAIRDCPQDCQIWNRFVPTSFRAQFFSGNVVHWLNWNLWLNKMGSNKLPWNIMFGYVLWYNWSSCNMLIFVESPLNEDPVRICQRLTCSFLRAKNFQDSLT